MFQPWPWFLALGLAGCWTDRASAQAAAVSADREIDFRIEAQSLAAALDAYSLATGIELFYASELTRGLISARLAGRYTAQEAILVLLGGTGLRPRLTAGSAITLDRIVRRSNGPTTAVAVARGGAAAEAAPALRLDTLRVEARSARRVAASYRFYAAVVRNEVGRGLRRDKRLRGTLYRARLSLWLTPNGRVARTAVYASSGDAAIDAAIVAMLGSLTVRPTPPEGMPQPIHVDIRAGS